MARKARSLLDVMADAAGQVDLLRLRQNDRKLADAGWLLRHAVDTNVVALWVTPEAMAEHGRDRRLGFGEVFRDDPAGLAIAFAALLADYIWMTLEQDRPLLLVPPIDKEVGGYIKLHATWPAPSPSDASQVHELVRHIRLKGYQLTAEEYGLILKAAVLDSANSQRSRRIERLYVEGRVVSLDLLDPKSGEDPDIQRVVRPWTRLDDMVRYSETKTSWMTRFEKINRPKSPNAEHDAEALARIELWNEALAADGLKKRLLYITGDSTILCSAAKYTPPWSKETFLKSFIRHPRSYLDDTGLFDSKAAETEAESSSVVRSEKLTLAKWLTLLIGGLIKHDTDEIGEWNDSRFELKAEVCTAIENAELQKPNEADEILTRWSDFSSKFVRQAASTRGFLNRLEDADGPAEIAEVLTEIGPVVQGEIDEAQQRWVAAVTDARVLMEVLAHAGEPSRNVGRLCFEWQSVVQALISSARRWYQERRLDFGAYMQFRAELHRSDPSDYYIHLAVASMLAGGRQWESAKILSSYARTLKKGVTEYVAGNPNGREAYFFEAVCTRHSAKTSEQLDVADDLITEAERIAVAEMQSRPGLDIVPERFAAERLALRQTRAIFQWSESGPGEMNACFLALLADLSGMQRVIRGRIAAVRAEPVRENDVRSMSVARNERLDLLEDLLTRQLINMVSISLLVDTPESAQIGTEAAQELESKKAGLSFFGQLMRNAGSYIYLRNRKAKAAFDQLATRESFNQHAVFPFDRRRFTYIRSRVGATSKAEGAR